MPVRPLWPALSQSLAVFLLTFIACDVFVRARAKYRLEDLRLPVGHNRGVAYGGLLVGGRTA